MDGRLSRGILRGLRRLRVASRGPCGTGAYRVTWKQLGVPSGRQRVLDRTPPSPGEVGSMRRKGLLGEQRDLFMTVDGPAIVNGAGRRFVCAFCDSITPRRFFSLHGLRIHRAKMHRDRLPEQKPLALG